MKKIRNFSIIAHIDAGKSTLSDRFLELTNTVEPRKMKDQLLDRMDLERERGITIKLQPVRMEWKDYILNLIDTPGHMDFYLEVKRSLSAVEGAIILIDGIKGIQAQTLSNLELAEKLGLKIIPVINKIDLPNAEVDKVEEELKKLFPNDEISKISAKNGSGVEELLNRVIKEVPEPDNSGENVIFDSFFDSFHGVVNYVRVKKDSLKGRVGVFKPDMLQTDELLPGEIGYFLTGEKDAPELSSMVNPLVFASLFPEDYGALEKALKKLQLSDQAVSVEATSWPSLGRGFRCGFLGLLHMEIVLERLKREFKIEPVVTAPQVEIVDGKEPWVSLEIVTPREYLNSVVNLLNSIRGKHQEIRNLGPDRLVVVFEAPMADILVDFYDNLKSSTSGFASLSYHFLDFRESGLVEVDVLLAGEKIPAFSRLIPSNNLYRESKKFVSHLKDIIPRQNFAVAIQAVHGSNVIARETVKAFRKDVTAGMYGGDYTRKKKLLEKQKKGKKRMSKGARVNLDSEVFVKALKY
jgi:GTP-binding protein LepA